MRRFSKIILAIVAIIAFSQFGAANTKAQSFPDVNPNTEAGRAIEKLYKLKIVEGRSNGNFAPNDSITRAEVAKIMYGVLELELYDNKVYDPAFTDVPLNHWAASYIYTIQQWGVMNGHSNTIFKPSDKLTRGQMAVVLQNALKLPNGPSTLPFKDVPAKAYYRDAVASIYAAKITEGTTKTTYSPSGFVTRAQLALFLDRTGKLDELLLEDEDDFDIVDIAQVDGQIINEVRFRQILTKVKNEIWDISSTNYANETFFDDTTNTFQNLERGEQIFEVNFNSYANPIYLKVIVDKDNVASYQFKTKKTLLAEAKKLSGSAELTAIIESISKKHNVSPEYLNNITYSIDNEAGHYYTHVGGYSFYFEFNDLTPITLNIDTDKTTHEILITPYSTAGKLDFTAKLID